MSSSAAVIMSRQTKCTPEVIERIRGYVNGGATIKEACGACGVPWSTASDWARRGKKGEEPYASFVAGCQQAKMMHRAALALVITGAAKKGDWRAALALYDRRSTRQKERDREGSRAPYTPGAEGSEERVVLLYPVPMPHGADLSQLPLPSGYAIETTGEEVPRKLEAPSEPDEEWPYDDDQEED